MTPSLHPKRHIVLGYNGCDQQVGEQALRSNRPDGLAQAINGYDWLGPGIYFWETDPIRARQWAIETHERQVRREKEKGTPTKLRRPFAIGAIIDLGLCLDLTTS